MKKYRQSHKYGFTIWKSHDSVDALSMCCIRNREVKKGKHNCVFADKFISHEYLVFGSEKAALRYIRNNWTEIAGEGRHISEISSIAICKHSSNKLSSFDIVWVNPEIKTTKCVYPVSKKIKGDYKPIYKNCCVFDGYSDEIVNELKSNTARQSAQTKDLGPDTKIITNKYGTYWTGTYGINKDDKQIVFCGTDKEMFLSKSQELYSTSD